MDLSRITVSPFCPNPVQPLRKSAFFDKGLGLRLDLAVQKRTSHSDQDQGRIRGDLGIRERYRLSGLYGRSRQLSRARLSITPFSIMHLLDPLRHLPHRGTPSPYQLGAAGVVFLPERQAPVPQEILIIQRQLFQATPCYIGEL